MIKKYRKTLLIIIGVLLVATLSITYAYFGGIVGSGANTDINITGEAVTKLSFSKGNTISLNLNPSNVTEGGGNISDSTTSTATLFVANAVASETKYYQAYFFIENNTFIYTTPEKKPEIILSITGPNGDITSLDGLDYVSAVDAVSGETISGFDITTYDGLIRLKEDEEISGTSGQTVEEDWTVRVTFVNLDSNQSLNANKKMSTDFILRANKITGVVPDTYSSLVPVKVNTDGSNETISRIDPEYSDYENKVWANAVLTTTNSYSDSNYGTEVSENDIQGYYVWIPRYKYYTNADGSTTVELESASTPKSTGSGANGEFLTHPAFTTESGEEIEGFWISKYLLSTEDNSAQFDETKNEMLYSLPGKNAYMYNETPYFFDGVELPSESIEYGKLINNLDIHSVFNIIGDNEVTLINTNETSALNILSKSSYGITNNVATDTFPYNTGVTESITTSGNVSGVSDHINFGSSTTDTVRVSNNLNNNNIVKRLNLEGPINIAPYYIRTNIVSNISGATGLLKISQIQSEARIEEKFIDPEDKSLFCTLIEPTINEKYLLEIDPDTCEVIITIKVDAIEYYDNITGKISYRVKASDGTHDTVSPGTVVYYHNYDYKGARAVIK